VNRIWVSLYSPQAGERSLEKLKPEERQFLGHKLAALRVRYPKLLMNEGIAASLISPPRNPDECLFAKMTANFSADLRSRVEPCVFGGTPDCSQCGCAITSGLHWIRTVPVAGSLKINHFIEGSIRVGLMINRIHGRGGRVYFFLAAGADAGAGAGLSSAAAFSKSETAEAANS
jgi:hypothetical protein